MGINTICICDGCKDTKPAFPNFNYPQPNGWGKLELSIRSIHNHDVKVDTYYICGECVSSVIAKFGK